MRVLFILLFVSSCASSTIPLREQDRTLLIDQESASLIYPYNGEVCKYPNRRFFRRCSPKRFILKYDLTDKAVREKLIDQGFSCQSGMRFKY